MAYYKIKNITNTLAKRDPQKDKEVILKLNEGLFQKEYIVESGDEVSLECQKLPVDLQKLRMKGLVTIVEMSKNQFMNQIKETQKSESKVNVKIDGKKNVEKKSTTESLTKKKVGKKKSTTTTTEAPTTVE